MQVQILSQHVSTYVHSLLQENMFNTCCYMHRESCQITSCISSTARICGDVSQYYLNNTIKASIQYVFSPRGVILSFTYNYVVKASFPSEKMVIIWQRQGVWEGLWDPF